MAVTAVFGHRGSPDPSNGVGENTLEAFRRSRRLGAAGVELDVRLTADGGLAVHHDPVIDGVGPIHDLSTTQLPAHVPLLAEALDACTGMVVNIEIKNHPHEPGFDPADRAIAVFDGEREFALLKRRAHGFCFGLGDPPLEHEPLRAATDPAP